MVRHPAGKGAVHRPKRRPALFRGPAGGAHHRLLLSDANRQGYGGAGGQGVRWEYHRRGIGRALAEAAREHAAAAGYSFLQVKTVQMGRYRKFDETNRFYLSLGFREFEVFPKLWDEWNPCQVYVMALK